MRLLTDTKGELCLKDGTLFGYLQHSTPKQIETDKESQSVPSSKSKSCKAKVATQTLTYSNPFS